MSAMLKPKDLNVLKRFIPLNTLSDKLFAELISDLDIEEVQKGGLVFDQGDSKKEFIYLISGSIALYAGEMEMEVITTGSEAARFAIAHQLPRKVKGTAKTKSRIVRIPTKKLDQEKKPKPAETYMVDEPASHGGDWMATMLQSPVFQRLPAANLQKVMMKMEEVVFEPGQVVVKQGDPADYYYIIKQGSCELTRQSSKNASPIKLAELHDCTSFGEDALLSDAPRNVTVTMKGHGQLLRLTKEDFITLVKEPVLQYIEYEDAEQKVEGGAAWLDVRDADVFQQGHIEGSNNIPFFSLRMKISSLKHDQLQLLVCENGRTSEAAAFLLLKFGFNALILKGGMNALKELKKPIEEPAKTDEQPLKVDTSSASEITGAASTDNLLEDARQKIVSLEKLCASLNEEQNKLSIERDALQKERDTQEGLVSTSQSTLALYKEQIETLEKTQLKLKSEKQGELQKIVKEKSELEATLKKSQEKLLELESKRIEESTSFESLQQQVESLNRELKNKDQQLAEQSQALDKAQKALSDEEQKTNERLTLLEKENEQLINDKAQLDKEAESTNKTLESLQAEIAELEKTIQLHSESQDVENAKLTEKVQLLRAEKSAIEKQFFELEKQHDLVQTDINSLSDRLEATNSLLNGQSDKNKELLITLAEYEKKIEQGRTLHEKLDKFEEAQRLDNAKLRELSGKNESLQEALEQQQKKSSDLLIKLDGYIDEVARLGADNESKADLIKKQELLLSTKSKEYTSQQAEIECLSTDLTNVKESEAKVRTDFNQLSERVETLESELDKANAVVVTAQSELEKAQSVIAELNAKIESAEQVELDSKSTMEMLADEKRSMEDGFKQQLNDLKNELAAEQRTREAVELNLVDVETSSEQLTVTIEELVDELKQLKIAKQEDVGRIDQLESRLLEKSQKGSVEADKVAVLERQLNEEKQDNEKKTQQLTELLQSSQKEMGALSLKLDELLDIKTVLENEKTSMEQKIALYEQNKQALTENIKSLEERLSQPQESEESLAKIKRLEKQLDETKTALVDMEVKFDNMGEESKNSNDEGSELLAVKSELLLVREQTEADIKAMKEMLDNSNKMNMALKKELLSLQAASNQGSVQEPEKKKKGLWR